MSAETIPLPDIADLNGWQMAGLACALCKRQLLAVGQFRLGTVHDHEGNGYDLHACELCVIRAVGRPRRVVASVRA